MSQLMRSKQRDCVGAAHFGVRTLAGCGLAAFVVGPAALLAGETHTNIAGFEVTVETARSCYPTGTPVIAMVTVSNGTSQQVTFEPSKAYENAFGGFLVQSLSTGSNLACRRWDSGYARDAERRVLRPAMGEHLLTDLGQYCGLRDVGDYSLQLLFRLPSGAPEQAGLVVPAPPLQIHISDSPPSEAWNGASLVEEAGPTLGGLRLKVKLPRRDFAIGESVPLVVLLENESATGRLVREPVTTGSLWNLFIRTADGGAVPALGPMAMHTPETAPEASPGGSRAGEKHGGGGFGQGGYTWSPAGYAGEVYGTFDATIPPGQRRWYDYRLDQKFDLRKPGTYIVDVRLRAQTGHFSPTTGLPALVCPAITFRIVR